MGDNEYGGGPDLKDQDHHEGGKSHFKFVQAGYIILMVSLQKRKIGVMMEAGGMTVMEMEEVVEDSEDEEDGEGLEVGEWEDRVLDLDEALDLLEEVLDHLVCRMICWNN